MNDVRILMVENIEDFETQGSSGIFSSCMGSSNHDFAVIIAIKLGGSFG